MPGYNLAQGTYVDYQQAGMAIKLMKVAFQPLTFRGEELSGHSA